MSGYSSGSERIMWLAKLLPFWDKNFVYVEIFRVKML